MKYTFKFFLLVSLFIIFILPKTLQAEDKPSGQAIPPIPKTSDDPVLTNAHVYPMWGPICQRYTYSVIYQDKENRAPEYVRMYFNGNWIDIEKEDPLDNDYKKGVKYIYKFVPKKRSSNFYFFETSNGLGKARDGIIESPDNGPVLFDSAFDKNEIALINAQSGEKIWSYQTAKDWIGGVALSDDGKYLAAQATGHVYLFDTTKSEPSWDYNYGGEYTVERNDVKGGIDISSDGSLIFASIGQWAFLFSKDLKEPLWKHNVGNQCYNAAISADGEYMAVACAGTEEDVDTNLLILFSKKSSNRLWQYHSSGNFHDVSLSADGQWIAAATGCPDRRGYLFSKDSKEPIWKTEMLTRDSPVHRAKISADGSMIAFGSESDGGALFLFLKSSNKPQWKFAAPGEPSFRAISLTPSGEYVGGATTLRGDAYIFNSSSSNPLASWKVDASLGAVDIADDGSFLAVGGTDNKVHIFERDSKKERAVVDLNEHVGEIDISGDGQYIAAGTSGSVYFFESMDVDVSEAQCDTIIEPEPESSYFTTSSDQEAEQIEETYCGDTICVSPPESKESCPQDCDPDILQTSPSSNGKTQPRWPGMLFGVGFLISILGLSGYMIVAKIRSGIKVEKKVVIALLALSLLFFILSLASVLANRKIP